MYYVRKIRNLNMKDETISFHTHHFNFYYHEYHVDFIQLVGWNFHSFSFVFIIQGGCREIFFES